MFILYFVEEENICHYCLQAFSTEETLKCHINDSSKANGKQKINMSNLKIMKEKQKCHLWSMHILKVFWCQKVITKKSKWNLY